MYVDDTYAKVGGEERYGSENKEQRTHKLMYCIYTQTYRRRM